jgi:hypothetical protein
MFAPPFIQLLKQSLKAWLPPASYAFSQPRYSKVFLYRIGFFTLSVLVCSWLATGLWPSRLQAQVSQQGPVQLNGFVQQAQLVATDGEGSDQLAKTVALSGDTVLVGAPGDNVGANANQGSAYVFRRNGSTWTQEAQLLAADGLAGDAFGIAVALDGDVAVVGSSFDDKAIGSNAGSVYVFRRSGTTWTFEQKLTPSDPQPNDRFGSAVSIQGNTILVGAPLKDIGANPDQGGVYAFKFASSVWSQQPLITAANGAASDEFGTSVAFTGGSSVVGAPGRTGQRGTAYVYTTDGLTWTLQQELTSNTLAEFDRFGNAVALNGETALIGAPQGLLSRQGTAFVFTRAAAVWTEQAQLSANDGAADDGFGAAVALVGDTALVGAPTDDGGVNDQVFDQGAGYVFVRTGTNWAQQNKLAITDGAEDDQAGIAVAVSATHAVLGVWLKDIGQSVDQGAAFVFNVTCQSILIGPGALAAGTPNAAYSQQLTASGGTAPYAFELSSGGLPQGITLAGNGLLAGTTALAGNFNFTVKATDANGCFNTRAYTLNVGACPTITFNPQILTPEPVNQQFNQPILASGGAGPYSFIVTSGTLPPGLELAPGGVLVGLPTVQGSYTFSVRATDTNGCSGTRTYTQTITCQIVTMTPGSLPSAQIGVAYNQVLTANGGTAPYTYSVNGGSLPTGLTLTASGVLSGTPTAAGDFTFGIKATDAGGCAVTNSYFVPVCAAITVNPAVLVSGRLNQPYPTVTFTATGGTGAYTFGMTGTLPAGLSFVAGVLSGTPTETGSFALTVTATDGGNCPGIRQYTLIVNRRAVVADFDGDGKTDLSVWRGATSEWLAIRSGNGNLFTANWGSQNAPFNDVAVPGDYDGDGKIDVAVFRRQNGFWYVIKSLNGQIIAQAWGVGTDIPVPGDYDGDGKTDFAVWRPADKTWYILKSSDGQFLVQAWGDPGAPFNDVAVPADYDGDGKTDIAIFRRQTGTWYVRKSSDGQAIIQAWGAGTDTPVAADYDGDGKADLAVWRGSEGKWYILKSSNGQFQIVSWGTAALGDVPVPGDYDGDQKTDIAVWRASTGVWYVLLSSNGTFLIQAHGQAGDTPLPH